MKMRAVVIDVDDPEARGRVRARLLNTRPPDNETSWCTPCAGLAGGGYGIFCIPELGDEIWVEDTDDGTMVYTGGYWTARAPIPGEAVAPSVRLLRTPIGHQVILDDREDGRIEVLHTNGNRITINADGSIEVQVNDKLAVNVDGDAELTVAGDATVEVGGETDLTSAGKTVVDASQIELRGNAARVVTTLCACTVTGAVHPIGAKNVFSEGP